MKLGQVIGRLTMSHHDPALSGGRYLVLSPLDSEQMRAFAKDGKHAPLRPLSSELTPVVYDNLGAGIDDVVAYVEGAEATAPFDQPTPLDACTVAIMDSLHYEPIS